MNEPSIIILAAGESSRLGRPKQLLPYRGALLVQRIIDEALKAELFPVLLITGAYGRQVRDCVSIDRINIVTNQHWHTGMASGITNGIEALLQMDPQIGQVIISVCDQPLISSLIFNQMKVKQKQSGKGIIACAYADTVGTPVLFSRRYFDELLQLSGEEGAKKIIQKHPGDTATIPFPGGDLDIDTPQDYADLLKTAFL